MDTRIFFWISSLYPLILYIHQVGPNNPKHVRLHIRHYRSATNVCSTRDLRPNEAGFSFCSPSSWIIPRLRECSLSGI